MLGPFPRLIVGLMLAAPLAPPWWGAATAAPRSPATPTLPARAQSPQTAAPVETPAQTEAQRMGWEYMFGDADAAVAYFARRWPPDQRDPNGGLPSLPSRHPAPPTSSVPMSSYAQASFARVLLATEIGMRAKVFGKIANSAPLMSAEGSVGLGGMFELQSLTTYRHVTELLSAVEHATNPAPSFREDATAAIRSWFIVTASHCLRWKLACADALVAGAKAELAPLAEILLLDGAIAESHRDTVRAEKALRWAISTDASLVEAHLRLGRVLAGSGRLTEGRRELQLAFDTATLLDDVFSRYFAAMALADLDQAAGRTTSAAARRKDVAKLTPFSDPLFAGLTPAEIYASAEFYQQPRRIAALRSYVRD